MAKERRRAFLSLSDRTGAVELAQGLIELGFDVVAAGGTARTLRQYELEIEELVSPRETPRALESKLRLLQPPLTAALLADRTDAKERAAADLMGQGPFDLVAINLYPLSQVLEQEALTHKEVMSFVDVSACALLRAAARDYEQTIVLCDPVDYDLTVEALREFGELPVERRQALAAKAFHTTAYYDSMIAQFLTERSDALPDELVMGLRKVQELSYGENPQQRGAVYALSGARGWGLAAANRVHGKELSYRHYLDLEAAWELAAEFDQPGCAIVRRAHTCGAAMHDRLAESARLALLADPHAVHEATAAFNRPVDEDTARLIAGQYLECVVAPDFSHQALGILRVKKDLRLITLPSLLVAANEIHIHSISGGLLVEDKDNQTFGADARVVTKRTPDELETAAARFAWKVAKHAKSHAQVLVKGTQTVGIGAGQPTAHDAVRLAIAKANERHPILDPKSPLVLACDGPFPLRCFPEAAGAGVSVIIQSGGSSEDKETIRACDSRGISMIFTGLRHYKL